MSSALSEGEPATVRRARVEHERWLRRITWWEQWRGVLMVPLVLAGLSIGGLIGFWVEGVARLPSQTRFVGAVLGVLAVGRLIAWQFAHHRLEAARQRHLQLARQYGLETRHTGISAKR